MEGPSGHLVVLGTSIPVSYPANQPICTCWEASERSRNQDVSNWRWTLPRPLARLLRMRINPFRIEQYFGKYEFTARYLLSSSDAESCTIKELLDLGPDDHVIVETPCFESGLEVARSTGAQVSEWRRSFEDGWAHNVVALEKLIQPNTKVIYINTPHNPTGLLMPAAVFQQVIALAASRNIILFSDEVYRELEHNPATRLPAACEAYERGVSLGSMSKTYGLPGLRLGWLASRDPEIIRRCLEFKYYTTICSSAPSEFLTALALRHREVLVQRNLQIVLRNLRLLDAFIQQRPHWFEWVKPNAGPIGFAHFKPQRDVLAFCEEVVRDSGVLLLPGTVYDQPRHIRFGFGRKNMPESLAQFGACLDARS